MNRNKYLLLGSSLGVLLLLLVSAFQEHFRMEWRDIQSAGRTDQGPIGVQLRQIINPGMRVSDRCVSCHVTMGPGEQGVTGHKVLTAHKNVVHDPAEYGCTICHGGQGLATVKDDAHGDVHFWPSPMLSAKTSYAGCGTCHTPIGVPSESKYREARLAYDRLDCAACHRTDGRGGTIRPNGGGMEGPDLSRVGLAGYDAVWYDKHAVKSQQARQGPWKTSFAAINEPDRELLSVYMSTLVGAPQLIAAKAAFHSSGCLGCHKVSGVGGDEGPDISRSGEKDPGQVDFAHVAGARRLDNWLAEHFRSPAAVVAGSLMPAQGFGEARIEALTFYTLSLRRRDLPGSYMPKDRLKVARLGEREFATDGETLFGAFCSGCHGASGTGLQAPGMAAFPSIVNPDLLALASDEFIAETVRRGRPGRRMPPWGGAGSGLRPAEIQAVVGYLRRIGGVQAEATSDPARWVTADAGAGKRLFAAACSGCHGARGEGGAGPALNNQVLLETAGDTFLTETVGRGRRGTGMAAFRIPSPIRPALSNAEIESIVAFIRTWQGKKS